MINIATIIGIVFFALGVVFIMLTAAKTIPLAGLAFSVSALICFCFGGSSLWIGLNRQNKAQ